MSGRSIACSFASSFRSRCAARPRNGRRNETAADTRRLRQAMDRCTAQASRARPSVRQAGACTACTGYNADNAYNVYYACNAYNDDNAVPAGPLGAPRAADRAARDSTCSPRARRRSSTPTAPPRRVFSLRLCPIIRTLILRIICTLTLRNIRTLTLRNIRTLSLRIIRTLILRITRTLILRITRTLTLRNIHTVRARRSVPVCAADRKSALG